MLSNKKIIIHIRIHTIMGENIKIEYSETIIIVFLL